MIGLLAPTALAFLVATAPSHTVESQQPALAPSIVAADTTFAPEGNYALDVTIEGDPFKMAFAVTKKPDGTWSGIFKNDDIGDYPTKSFKLEGRTMTMTIETPGGPAMIVLTVKPDQTVEGEWSGAGDGSKITGKKVS